eukprot:snap_masked-scaffold_39-processed-gene-2.44-mRNA-1 protein AED:1.00 eAED:1.00 QI:0/-1/0/0/-1/1/1/0/74
MFLNKTTQRGESTKHNFEARGDLEKSQIKLTLGEEDTHHDYLVRIWETNTLYKLKRLCRKDEMISDDLLQYLPV